MTRVYVRSKNTFGEVSEQSGDDRVVTLDDGKSITTKVSDLISLDYRGRAIQTDLVGESSQIVFVDKYSPVNNTMEIISTTSVGTYTIPVFRIQEHPNPWKPLVVSFEGNDGAGKGTQIKLLTEKLVRYRIPHLVARTPGSGGDLGEYIRNTLLHTKWPRSKKTEELLFAAARQNIVDTLNGMYCCDLTSLKPVGIPSKDVSALPVVVILDRFDTSTLAYQGRGDVEMTEKLAAEINQLGHDMLPDVEIYLDVSYETARSRIAGKKYDYFESRGEVGFMSVSRGYRLAMEVSNKRLRLQVPELNITETEDMITGCFERVFECNFGLKMSSYVLPNVTTVVI